MAVDQALLENAARLGPTLRLYRWRPACLSFGRNQQTLGRYDPARLRARGLDVVRRPTGGLAVLHDAELTYAVAAPVADIGRPRAAYAAISAALVEGLRRLGVGARVVAAADGRAPAPDAAYPCFGEAAPGEIAAGAGKLVGSAQRAEHGCLLQHGSILLDGDQAAVAALGTGPAPVAGSGRNATIAGLLGALPPVEAVGAAVIAGFEARIGILLAPRPLDSAERERARTLETHFASDAWTWRR
jgi:lipoyl(octanoyl) transferase